MSQTSFDKDKIRILLLEGVHASAIERFHAAGYENIERRAGALQGDELVTSRPCRAECIRRFPAEGRRAF